MLPFLLFQKDLSRNKIINHHNSSRNNFGCCSHCCRADQILQPCPVFIQDIDRYFDDQLIDHKSDQAQYREDDKFVVWYTDKKGERKPRVFYNEGFKRITDLETQKCDNLPYLFNTPSMSLVERLTANKCELCGKEGNVVSHHVRKLSELRGKTEWERKMLKMHRKSLIVCAECHNMIHAENS